MARATNAVGRNVLRKEGVEKVTGARTVHRRPLRSPACCTPARSDRRFPAGEIADIRFNFDTAGFTIVDHRDIPGRNVVALIEDDQPCLAERTIRHVAEPILLLAHEDREHAARRRGVRSTTGPTTPVYDPQRRRPPSSRRIAIDKGSVDDGFAAADVDRRGRVPHRPSGAALHRAERRRSRCPARRRDHGLRVAAVPVLRAPGARRSCSVCRTTRCA